MTRRERIILFVAVGFVIAWAKALIDYPTPEIIQLCRWPDAHPQNLTWRGPVQIAEGR